MRTFAVVGAIMAALAVAFGAFGTHALRDLVTAARLDTFETAVRYQLFHALALLALGAGRLEASRLLTVGASALIAGSTLFCGSLYLLVLSDQGWLGAVAPLGGVLMIGGWVLVAVALTRTASPRQTRSQQRG